MSTTLKTILATAALGVALTAPAMAQVKGPVNYFTAQNVVAILKEMGAGDATARKHNTQSGKPLESVIFTVENMKHVAVLSACNDPKGCLGLELVTIWTDAGKTVNRVHMNNFNAAYPFGKAFVGPENTIIFQRYAISDGGVSVQNVKSNIGNFVVGTRVFQEYMSKAGSGQQASLKADEANVHMVAAPISEETSAAIKMYVGESQGVNTMSLPVEPAAPAVAPSAPLKPAK